MSTSTDTEPNVGLALGLVCAAGAATALGASVVFFPSLVKLASRRVLAAALGFSAGVMLYVSVVEIFVKSYDSFLAEGMEDKWAYLYATLCFFGGVVMMLVIDLVVRLFSGGDDHHHCHDHSNSNTLSKSSPRKEKEDVENQENSSSEPAEVVTPHCIGGIDDPVGELEKWQKLAQAEEDAHQQEISHEKMVGDHTTNTSGTDFESRGDEGKNRNEYSGTSENGKRQPPVIAEEGSKETKLQGQVGSIKDPPTEALVKADIESVSSIVTAEQHANKKLVRMGINTALAIGIHNFPEGLATFVAALDDPRVGAVLAIAIGIHNIPEGLCVSLPIYYATGNRCKAFLWALISGLSEPIAALLGWIVLASIFSESLYAVLFGFVAGMMVIISVKELLPTAHRYDVNDTVVTYSLICGMVVMALSLVLFKF